MVGYKGGEFESGRSRYGARWNGMEEGCVIAVLLRGGEVEVEAGLLVRDEMYLEVGGVWVWGWKVRIDIGKEEDGG